MRSVGARDRRFWVWIAALSAIVAAFALLALTRPVFPFAILVGLGSLALAVTFLVDPNKRFYLWTFGAAALTALPYAVHLARHARSLVALQEAWGQVQMMAVGLPGFALFFAGYGVAAVVGYVWTRDRPVLVWASSLLVATSFLAVNHLGTGAITRIASRSTSSSPWPSSRRWVCVMCSSAPAAVLGAWLGAVCLFDVGSFVLGRPCWCDSGWPIPSEQPSSKRYAR